MSKAALTLVLVALAPVVDGAIAIDEVTSLPGWPGKLPSRQWSGYLDVGPKKNRHLHCESLCTVVTCVVIK